MRLYVYTKISSRKRKIPIQASPRLRKSLEGNKWPLTQETETKGEMEKMRERERGDREETERQSGIRREIEKGTERKKQTERKEREPERKYVI